MTAEEAKDIPFIVKEFRQLEYLLTKADIPYEEIITEPSKGYPNTKYKISDVVLFRGSYGYANGTLEMMGLVDEEKYGDTVRGHMTAQEVFDIWKEDWERRMSR